MLRIMQKCNNGDEDSVAIEAVRPRQAVALNFSAMRAKIIRMELEKLADPAKAKLLQRFFKTAPGQYGEGDIFLGITVPDLRALARQYYDLTPTDALSLLESKYHEERVLALLILIRLYEKGDEAAKKKIYELYLANTKFINNWDLVDASAPYIVGAFLMDKSRKALYALARSADLWERRISIIATARFIRNNQFADTLGISKLLLADRQDLIHKAVGWMLREVGKRDQAVEEQFLREHYKKMPRTMLRYAIERMPEAKRQAYLKGKI
jgi:3-methyladenine DNA glycosylase AlkD